VALRNEVSGLKIRAKMRYIAREGQFILSRIDARNGAFGLVPDFLDGAVVSNDFPCFDIDQARLLPVYLEWMSKTHGFVELCQKASEGTTNRVRLQLDRFSRLETPLPPLPEQRRIVARIEELAAKIEAARALCEQIEREQESLLHNVFQTIVADAEYKPMSTVAPIVRRWVDVDIAQEYHELGVRSFGKGTFHKPAISGMKLGSKRILWIEPGDLLLMNVFAWEGAIAVVQPEDQGRVGSHRYITCVPKEGIVTAPFLCFYFLTPEGLAHIGEASPGGAGRNRTLGLRKLEQIEVPVPHFDDQRWFDELQSKVGAIRAMQGETITMLDALLPSILYKAFKGEL
jgi:type I restriction enzyme S subunit